jgi:preprotein translocase subunit SecG
MNILINVLLGLNMLVALLMVLVILMQRPKSEGLGAAFGGGMTENIFGAQTTNVLTKFTGWLAGIFLVLTFVLSILYAQRSLGRSSRVRELLPAQAAVPAAAPQAVPSPGTMLPAVSTPGQMNAAVSPAPAVQPSDQAVGAVPVPPVNAPPSPTASAPLPQSP